MLSGTVCTFCLEAWALGLSCILTSLCSWQLLFRFSQNASCFPQGVLEQVAVALLFLSQISQELWNSFLNW